MFELFFVLQTATQVVGGGEWRHELMRRASYPVRGRLLYWVRQPPQNARTYGCPYHRHTMRRGILPPKARD